ncbi:hypothetical protein BSYN_23180 [Bacteroides sedimenti]|uniref:Uncharacterized protein n=1 Tax=Bacteroides sedimenti TaxID=2136147 RepID=A0ABN6Z698_9BACE
MSCRNLDLVIHRATIYDIAETEDYEFCKKKNEAYKSNVFAKKKKKTDGEYNLQSRTEYLDHIHQINPIQRIQCDIKQT